MKLPVTDDSEANLLLERNPLALLLGMLLDQQVPMEWAFAGPQRLRERLGGDLTADAVVALGEEGTAGLFSEKPALHRYPGSMGKRAFALCAHVEEQYGGDAARIWQEAQDAADLRRRLKALPGFGDEKARIFLALLAKRFGVRPEGWEDAAAPFSDPAVLSVADVDSPEALARVREYKRAQKARKQSEKPG